MAFGRLEEVLQNHQALAAQGTVMTDERKPTCHVDVPASGDEPLGELSGGMAGETRTSHESDEATTPLADTPTEEGQLPGSAADQAQRTEAAIAQLMRKRPPLPPELKEPRILTGDRFRLGTIDDAMDPEEAEEFFNEPDPYKKARVSAAEKLGRLSL